MLGYLKGIPQELIIMYGIGKSCSRCFAVLTLTVVTIFGLEMMVFFFPMLLMLGPYIICFEWMDGRRMEHEQYFNAYKIRSVNFDEDEDDLELNKTGSIVSKKRPSKDLDIVEEEEFQEEDLETPTLGKNEKSLM